jgi:hypothetical protein
MIKKIVKQKKSEILECIVGSRLVETCSHLKMYTPTLWIMNVFEILQEKQFCQRNFIKIPI